MKKFFRITILISTILFVIASSVIPVNGATASETKQSIMETLKKTEAYYFFNKTQDDPLVKMLLPLKTYINGDCDYHFLDYGLQLSFDSNPKKNKAAKIQEVGVEKPYPGPLWQGLLFNDSYQEITRKLGRPLNWGYDWLGFNGPIKLKIDPNPMYEQAMLQVFIDTEAKVRKITYVSLGLKRFFTIPWEYLGDPDNVLSLIGVSMKAEPNWQFWGAFGKIRPTENVNETDEFYFADKGIKFTLQYKFEFSKKGETFKDYNSFIVLSVTLDPIYRGGLPDGLSFEDTLATLETKLGKPYYYQLANEYEYYGGVAVCYKDDKIQYVRFSSRKSVRNQLDPAALTKGIFNNLPRYLGKNIKDEAIQELMKAYGNGIRSGSGDLYSYGYHRYGLRLQFDKTDTLYAIVLQGYSDFGNHYLGPLPRGINIGDNKDTVDKKLGSPLEVKKLTESIIFAKYSEGMTIQYNGSKIEQITLE